MSHYAQVPGNPLHPKVYNRKNTLLKVVASIGIGIVCIGAGYAARDYLPDDATLSRQLRYINVVRRCKAGYEHYEDNKMCYKTVIEPETFTKALSICKREGGSLVSIHNEQENDFVSEVFLKSLQAYRDQKHPTYGASKTWIGLARTKNGWQWTDGSELDYRNFGFIDAKGSNHAQMNMEEFNGGAQKMWNNADSEKKAFTCKMKRNEGYTNVAEVQSSVNLKDVGDVKCSASGYGSSKIPKTSTKATGRGPGTGDCVAEAEG